MVPALDIVPTFAANILSHPSTTTIQNTINTAIAAYEQTFTADNVTINILFQDSPTGLGGSSTFFNTVTYANYRAALVTSATTADDTTALATLPMTTNNPVNNTANVNLKTALIRALGLTGGTVPLDSTISLNMSICNLDRTSTQDPAKFDLLAVTCHEIDEAIGFGSALEGLNNGDPAPATIFADDLFRFDQTGARSFDTALATQAFFSIDGGTTQLARFNQTQGGDFGDWFSTGPHTPQPQDAFSTAGATPNFVVELRRLDILGYRRGANATPVLTAATAQTGVEGASNAFNLGTFSDPDTAPWGVTVSWGDGTPNTSYFVGAVGGLGTQPHTYAEEGLKTVTVTVTDFTGLSDSKTFTVDVSDPAVVGTGGFVVNSVEGADSGSQTVATFTDPGGPEPLADYSAQIDWGDGTATSSGTISFAGGVFTVKGSHTYAEESSFDHPGSNPYDITVTISHDVAPNTVVHSSAIVSDPAVLPTAVVINAVEGADTGSVTVATFTDPGGAEPLADYSAVIDWGDGTSTTAGVISFSGGTFTVSGNHTYAEESAPDHPGSDPYAVTVTISHELALDAVANSTAIVSDPAVIPTGGFNFVAVEGVPSAVQTVATFTDPGGAESLSDYAALIDWGDGTLPSAGTISESGGVFTVKGSHTYATGLGEPGEFGNTFCDADPPSYHKPITVTISHEAAPTAVAVSDAQISIKPGTAHLTKLGSLIVVGTPANDSIVFNNVGGKTRTVTVQLGSAVLGTFTVSATGRIVVAAMGGNDSVQVASGIVVQTVQYGGPGNDRLKGGGGRNILVGCEGDDTLTAGNLGDLLVGGAGADRLVGGNGNDILVSALLVDGANNEDDSYTDLVNILNAGTIAAPLHVMDDGAVDKLTGGSGTDTAYFNYAGSGILDIATDGLEIKIDI